MTALESWALRGRTLRAMALLCLAQMLVRLLPLRWWRGTLGRIAMDHCAPEMAATSPVGPARRIAAHVERGAARLPFATKCLPRAMALCWLLRAAHIGYVLKIAVRPATARQARPAMDGNNLHAWVESGGATAIGALPGPWLVVLVLRG